MSTDAGVPVPKPEAPNLWKLPDVLNLHIRRRQFDPPKRVTTAGVDREVRDAIEVEIHVSEPFVIRALGPVLWVGDEPLTIAEAVGKETYRFFAFRPERLKADALITLSWNTPSSAHKATPFRYAAPAP